MNCKAVLDTLSIHLNLFQLHRLIKAQTTTLLKALAILTFLFSSATTLASPEKLSNMERCHQHAQHSFFGQDYDRTVLSYCNKAIRFDQLSLAERGRTYINRGVLLKNMLRIKYAAGDFRRARLHLRKAPEVDVNMGNIAYLNGRFDHALQQYDQALAKNIRQRYVAYLNRGLTLERLGDIDAAKLDYQRALHANPSIQNARERLIDLSVNVALETGPQPGTLAAIN